LQEKKGKKKGKDKKGKALQIKGTVLLRGDERLKTFLLEKQGSEEKKLKKLGQLGRHQRKA